jgi:hypothetical protein
MPGGQVYRREAASAAAAASRGAAQESLNMIDHFNRGCVA